MTTPSYTLDGEHETPRGWLYTFTVQTDSDARHIELTLSWVDHEHLVGGSIAPERVAEAVLVVALDFFGRDLPARFDVASLRRRIDGFEQTIRDRIDSPL
jgi:hypothetical protein